MTQKHYFEGSIRIEGMITGDRDVCKSCIDKWIKMWTDYLDQIAPEEAEGLKINFEPGQSTFYRKINAESSTE